MVALVAAYLIAMNVVTFAMFCVDKHRARTGEWRIPEKTLLGLSAIGGALGGIVGMRVAHHKTRKWYFAYGLPLMFTAHVVIAAAVLHATGATGL